ncbi:alkene reductase [Pseudonocardia broussonetiae]|uniref:Alkene reductase n=1 Tax=Pseudonocardia broussonetiae TaxID=2736640 RepID=A0A6M6JEH5_9PSEU|nr:alkene reductase [Pseudonocardia broussonetiae]QJY46348.1 alkene reductase [Pseudonocardia broussonetiae]
MPESPLLQPVTAGALRAANRVWMAPMTRNRADADGTPNDLSVEYYGQRAGAGVVITEGSQPSAVGQGYPNTAGVVTDANEAGWARVADAVHAEGGTLVVQLMHAGRISHTGTIGGATPVSCTATTARGEIVTTEGLQAYSAPRALATDELPGVAAEFADAARRAVRAGVDGVELHAANGYLLHQFLADGVNDRTDAYGGPAENRARFVVEVAKAAADAVGADRVGIRLSPANPYNDITEDDVSVYETLVAQLAEIGLAYVHLVAPADDPVVGKLRAVWPGVLVLNTGFAADSERDAVERIVADGVADAVAVGRPFIANPDLVTRWTRGAELTEPDPSTFYGGGAQGYTDYPRLAG